MMSPPSVRFFSTVISVGFIIAAAAIALLHGVNHSLYFKLGGETTIFFFLTLALATVSFWLERIWCFFVHFFLAKTHGLNLAIFRIAVCTALLICTYTQDHEVALFSHFNPILQMPPYGMGRILHYLPVTPLLATITTGLFTLSLLSSLAGFWTRSSLAVATVLGIYVLGIPQFYGKVDHYHHLLWFLALLASSPSGDFLSVDAVLLACPRKDEGNVTNEAPERTAYALPLRFAWILIGVIYFFPGFWKLAFLRTEWLHGFPAVLYRKWMEFDDGWLPVIRVDQYPFLCELMALGGVFFELSFLILIFFDRLRGIAVVMGLTFHALTNLLMRISFWNLQVCYVTFINWHKLFLWLGQRLFPSDLTLLYDNQRILCRRTVGVLRTLDLFERIHFLALTDRDKFTQCRLPSIPEEDLRKEMQVVSGNKICRGLSAYEALITRMPALWVLWPFLLFPVISSIRERIYRHVVDSQASGLRDLGATPPPTVRHYSLRPIFATGMALLIINAGYGFHKIEAGWPFACYPTFAEHKDFKLVSLELDLTDDDGVSRVVRQAELLRFTGIQPQRLVNLFNGIIATDDPLLKKEKMHQFWKILQSTDFPVQHVRLVEIYQTELTTIPEQKSSNPLKRFKIYNFAVKQ